MTDLFMNILAFPFAGAFFAFFLISWLDFAPFYKIFRGKRTRK